MQHYCKVLPCSSYAQFTPSTRTRPGCLSPPCQQCEENWPQVKTIGDRKLRNCFVHLEIWCEQFCLDPVSNFPLGLVCKRVHSAGRTGQNCSVSKISRTTEVLYSLDLSPILFISPRQDSTVLLSRLCRWCELDINASNYRRRHAWPIGPNTCMVALRSIKQWCSTTHIHPGKA